MPTQAGCGRPAGVKRRAGEGGPARLGICKFRAIEEGSIGPYFRWNGRSLTGPLASCIVNMWSGATIPKRTGWNA